MDPIKKLCPPREFSFPFTPYEIQKDFMTSLFCSLEEKKLGIFESPTGTGKSLSLICGALTWLKLHSENEKMNLRSLAERTNVEEEGFGWFNAAVENFDQVQESKDAKFKLKNLLKMEEKATKFLGPKTSHSSFIKQNEDEWEKLFQDCKEVKENVQKELEQFSNESKAEDSDANFILDDYCSDDDEASHEEEEDECLKIFYCSRTHSQLSQFIHEIQKTSFAKDIRLAVLASRQNLCINQEVMNAGSSAFLNDRCLELQKKKKKPAVQVNDSKTKKRKVQESGCPFYKQNSIKNVAREVLLNIQDVEDSCKTGKKHNGCSYYGARYAVPYAQVVVVPYNLLFHKNTRESCKIKLKGNVVIVDEAHNLMETISNIHSVRLSHLQLSAALSQLLQYRERYGKRLSPKNLLYIKQILFFIRNLNKLFKSVPEVRNGTEDVCKTMTPSELLSSTNADNLNLFKIWQYIEKSNVANKMHGFHQNLGQVQSSSQKTDQEKVEDSVSNRPLLEVAEFMKALISLNAEGRVICVVSKVPSQCYLKYLLLNPSAEFRDLVRDCRSVILAGGTMSPMEEFRQQLFVAAGAPEERVQLFSCGHVVGKESALPVVLTHGPTNLKLDFTYTNRNNPELLDELGRILVNICNVVPGGIVCFLVSYDYEQKVFNHLLDKGVINRISQKKKVFREPKKSSDLDRVLGNYAKTIKSCSNNGSLTGSILFSVVGGKMSEGINFSDDLGRMVIMVGLPYPNTQSVEMKEKMNYLNENYTMDSDDKTAGSVFYENLCFKAVNQSIGRAIRHRNDFASILLLDQRYSRSSSQKLLPSWISKHLTVHSNFGQAFSALRKFYIEKRNQDNKV